MKKSFTKVLLAAAMFCVSSGASAYDFEAGGIYYNITSETDKTVEVTSGENKYFGDVSIPVTVEYGGDTYTVASIGMYAFAFCYDLTEITLPKAIETIGDNAFVFCRSLKSIDIPDGVISIGESAFAYCSSLESVTLGSGLETIGEYAFSYCRNLKSINIPDGVTSIEFGAFMDCNSLASIDIPDGVVSVGDYAFSGCSSLAEINCCATVPPVCGQYCFASVDISNCTLSVPEGVEEAYKTADVWKEFFYEYFMRGGIKYGVQTSPQGNIAMVVAGGDYTGDITIPATVENGGITYTVTSIRGNAFSYCSGLTSVDIPDGVTSLGDGAFSYCSGLTSVDIPDGVVSIGNSAFLGCSSLASIDIPDGVVSIGNSAFFACLSLTEITCRATVPPVCGERCFADVDISNCTLSVPEGTADDYRAADGWKEFFNIVETDFAGSGEIAADAAAAAKVYAAAGRIVVENAAAGTPIAVYTADGVQVYGGTASDGRTEIPAQAGKLYIVRCGNAAYKTAM